MIVLGKTKPWSTAIPDSVLRRWPNDIFLVDALLPLPPGTSADRCIAICDNVEPKDLLQLALSSGFPHLVQMNSGDLVHEVQLSAQMILNPQSFFEAPLQKILGTSPDDARDTYKYCIAASWEKDEMSASLRKYLDQVPRSSIIRDAALTIADELATNAVFNAPTTSDRHARYAACQRSTRIALKQSEAAEIFAAHDDKWLIVGCKDPFGSLDPMALLKRIHTCYNRGVSNSMNMGKGGAGIGCYMMFDYSAGFYIAVDSKRKTTICCSLPLRQRARTQEETAKNLHLISLNTNGEGKMGTKPSSEEPWDNLK